MSSFPEPPTRTITDARALKALANPERSRIIDLLSAQGPATASALAASLGLAVGSLSHHLKVLAAADLVVEAPELARDRRERWWRLVATRIRWSRAEFAEDPAAVTAARAAESMALGQQFSRAQEWLATDDQNPDWDDAAFATQSWLQVSPDELREFSAELIALVRRWRERQVPDDGAERRSVLTFARGFPFQP